jgi:hypothetical protein
MCPPQSASCSGWLEDRPNQQDAAAEYKPNDADWGHGLTERPSANDPAKYDHERARQDEEGRSVLRKKPNEETYDRDQREDAGENTYTIEDSHVRSFDLEHGALTSVKRSQSDVLKAHTIYPLYYK